MPDAPETKPDDIAPLLRIGLEDAESAAQTLDATMRVSAPTPRSGGSAGSRGWNPPSVEELQKALPQYEISAFIARGGMGAVYKGMQKTLKRPVAIKVLPPEIEDGDAQFAARFKHEAQAMAQLSHPNIVAVFDAGETPDGLLYFVMEFIEGTDVAQLIASEGQLEPLRAIQITTAVCEALAFAHEEGIIHRDIKPSNIMLDKRGRVKVADFGLAKTVNLEHSLQTQSNMALGTPDFIAPEALIPGMKVDQRADIYAVGVMLYQMLTGHIPRGRFELPSGVVPQVDKGFDPIVDKAMQTDREKRYSSATEMKRDVESVVMMKDGSAGTPARSTSSGGGTAKSQEAGKSARAPFLIAAAAVVVLGLGAFFITREPSGQAKVPPPSSSTANDAAGWSRVDLEAVRQAERGLTTAPGGWYRMSGMQTYSPFAERMTNAGLRVELGGRLLSGRMPEILLREQETRNYNAFLDGDGQSLVIQRYDGTVPQGHPDHYRTLGSQRLKKPVPSGSPYTLEFVAVGRRLRARINDTTLEVEAPDPPAAGLVTLYNPDFDTFREIEQINLDGLSEAAALKAVGIEAGSPAPSPQVSPSPGAAKPWVNLLKGSEPLSLVGRVTRQGQAGLLFEGTGIAFLETPMADSAVRFQSVFDGFRGEAIVRKSAEGSYNLFATNETTLTLQCNGGNAVRPTRVLRDFPLRTPLKKGELYELELQAVGQTLTAKLNGEIVGTVTDKSFRHGTLGVGISGIRSPVVVNPVLSIRTLEYLNLDGLSEAEALKAATAPSQSPPWSDVTAELRNAGLANGSLKLDGDWLETVRTTWPSPAGSRLFRDFAVRITYANRIEVQFRKTAAGSYAASAEGDVCGLFVTDRSDDRQRLLPVTKLTQDYNAAAPHEFLLLARGPQLSIWIDGRKQAEAADARHTEGGVSLSLFADGKTPPPRIKKVEYLPLDGLSEAEARKAAGIALSTPAPVEVPYATLGNDGMIHFPAGVWSWMRTREDQALQREVHAIEKEDAWMRWDERTYGPPAKPPPVGVQNLGVRVWFRGRRVKEWDFPQINLRSIEGQAGPNFHIKFGKLQIRSRASGFPILAEAALSEPLTPGKEYHAEFYAIGSRLIARVNGQTVTAESDVPPAPGYFSIHGADMDWFKDPHVLNLDGLSEAEARKTAGIEAAAAKTVASAAPWQRIDFATMDAADLSNGKTYSGKDGDTFHLSHDEMRYAPDPFRGPEVRNGAIRATVRWDAKTFMPRLVTRMDKTKQYAAYLSPTGIGLNLYDGADQLLQGFKMPAPFKAGDTVVFQLASIGTQHFLWVDGRLVGTVEDAQQTGPGKLAIQANNAHYLSMEWLPLDGLSEAEALKVLGIQP